jgi:hypothetical protein
MLIRQQFPVCPSLLLRLLLVMVICVRLLVLLLFIIIVVVGLHFVTFREQLVI